LLSRAERVVAIEIDTVLVQYLRQRFQPEIEAGRFELIEGDVLKTDLGQWGRAVIAGNLPYYITSPILERVFAARTLWDRAVFLVQAEVAGRLAAEPGVKDYGYLSVSTQVRANVERLLEVPRAAFKPPPKVDSAVVRLHPIDATREFGLDDIGAFLKFASVCFRHKRKTLRNNLLEAYARQSVEVVVEPKVRAEALSIQQLLDIHRQLRLADGRTA